MARRHPGMLGPPPTLEVRSARSAAAPRQAPSRSADTPTGSSEECIDDRLHRLLLGMDARVPPKQPAHDDGCGCAEELREASWKVADLGRAIHGLELKLAQDAPQEARPPGTRATWTSTPSERVSLEAGGLADMREHMFLMEEALNGLLATSRALERQVADVSGAVRTERAWTQRHLVGLSQQVEQAARARVADPEDLSALQAAQGEQAAELSELRASMHGRLARLEERLLADASGERRQLRELREAMEAAHSAHDSAARELQAAHSALQVRLEGLEQSVGEAAQGQAAFAEQLATWDAEVAKSQEAQRDSSRENSVALRDLASRHAQLQEQLLQMQADLDAARELQADGLAALQEEVAGQLAAAEAHEPSSPPPASVEDLDALRSTVEAHAAAAAEAAARQAAVEEDLAALRGAADAHAAAAAQAATREAALEEAVAQLQVAAGGAAEDLAALRGAVDAQADAAAQAAARQAALQEAVAQLQAAAAGAAAEQGLAALRASYWEQAQQLQALEAQLARLGRELHGLPGRQAELERAAAEAAQFQQQAAEEHARQLAALQSQGDGLAGWRGGADEAIARLRHDVAAMQEEQSAARAALATSLQLPEEVAELQRAADDAAAAVRAVQAAQERQAGQLVAVEALREAQDEHARILRDLVSRQAELLLRLADVQERMSDTGELQRDRLSMVQAAVDAELRSLAERLGNLDGRVLSVVQEQAEVARHLQVGGGDGGAERGTVAERLGRLEGALGEPAAVEGGGAGSRSPASPLLQRVAHLEEQQVEALGAHKERLAALQALQEERAGQGAAVEAMRAAQDEHRAMVTDVASCQAEVLRQLRELQQRAAEAASAAEWRARLAERVAGLEGRVGELAQEHAARLRQAVDDAVEAAGKVGHLAVVEEMLRAQDEHGATIRGIASRQAETWSQLADVQQRVGAMAESAQEQAAKLQRAADSATAAAGATRAVQEWQAGHSAALEAVRRALDEHGAAVEGRQAELSTQLAEVQQRVTDAAGVQQLAQAALAAEQRSLSERLTSFEEQLRESAQEQAAKLQRAVDGAAAAGWAARAVQEWQAGHSASLEAVRQAQDEQGAAVRDMAGRQAELHQQVAEVQRRIADSAGAQQLAEAASAAEAEQRLDRLEAQLGEELAAKLQQAEDSAAAAAGAARAVQEWQVDHSAALEAVRRALDEHGAAVEGRQAELLRAADEQRRAHEERLAESAVEQRSLSGRVAGLEEQLGRLSEEHAHSRHLAERGIEGGCGIAERVSRLEALLCGGDEVDQPGVRSVLERVAHLEERADALSAQAHEQRLAAARQAEAEAEAAEALRTARAAQGVQAAQMVVVEALRGVQEEDRVALREAVSRQADLLQRMMDLQQRLADAGELHRDRLQSLQQASAAEHSSLAGRLGSLEDEFRRLACEQSEAKQPKGGGADLEGTKLAERVLRLEAALGGPSDVEPPAAPLLRRVAHLEDLRDRLAGLQQAVGEAAGSLRAVQAAQEAHGRQLTAVEALQAAVEGQSVATADVTARQADLLLRLAELERMVLDERASHGEQLQLIQGTSSRLADLEDGCRQLAQDQLQAARRAAAGAAAAEERLGRVEHLIGVALEGDLEGDAGDGGETLAASVLGRMLGLEDSLAHLAEQHAQGSRRAQAAEEGCSAVAERVRQLEEAIGAPADAGDEQLPLAAALLARIAHLEGCLEEQVHEPESPPGQPADGAERQLEDSLEPSPGSFQARWDDLEHRLEASLAKRIGEGLEEQVVGNLTHLLEESLAHRCAEQVGGLRRQLEESLLSASAGHAGQIERRLAESLGRHAQDLQERVWSALGVDTSAGEDPRPTILERVRRLEESVDGPADAGGGDGDAGRSLATSLMERMAQLEQALESQSQERQSVGSVREHVGILERRLEQSLAKRALDDLHEQVGSLERRLEGSLGKRCVDVLQQQMARVEQRVVAALEAQSHEYLREQMGSLEKRVADALAQRPPRSEEAHDDSLERRVDESLGKQAEQVQVLAEAYGKVAAACDAQALEMEALKVGQSSDIGVAERVAKLERAIFGDAEFLAGHDPPPLEWHAAPQRPAQGLAVVEQHLPRRYRGAASAMRAAYANHAASVARRLRRLEQCLEESVEACAQELLDAQAGTASADDGRSHARLAALRASHADMVDRVNELALRLRAGLSDLWGHQPPAAAAARHGGPPTELGSGSGSGSEAASGDPDEFQDDETLPPRDDMLWQHVHQFAEQHTQGWSEAEDSDASCASEVTPPAAPSSSPPKTAGAVDLRALLQRLRDCKEQVVASREAWERHFEAATARLVRLEESERFAPGLLAGDMRRLRDEAAADLAEAQGTLEGRLRWWQELLQSLFGALARQVADADVAS